jgi:phosphatidylinositol alpha-mannosyltransferase
VEKSFRATGLEPVGRALTRRPLRVCQIVPYDLSDRGGVKHHALQLARALRALGDEVTILGPSEAPQLDPHVTGISGVVNVKGNGSDNRLGLLVSPWKVRKFFRERQFDVVHVHEPLAPVLPYWAAWFSRSSAHLATFHAFSEDYGPTLGILARLAARALRPAFQVSMAVSDAAARSAKRVWPASTSIVPNGVPTDIFRPRPGPRPPGPVSLLFVGRIGDARKGYRYLEAAFQRLRARGVDVTLDVVGELGGAPAPGSTPGLTYHGSVPIESLVQRYQRADIFIAPSTGQESFGIVLLEAMAVGVPVVCSDIDGYRQTVSATGAVLTPPRDVQALETAIANLVASPGRWRAMGEVNRRRAALYDWRCVAQEIRALYHVALRLRFHRASPPGLADRVASRALLQSTAREAENGIGADNVLVAPAPWSST